jgi:hypothetical protein
MQEDPAMSEPLTMVPAPSVKAPNFDGVPQPLIEVYESLHRGQVSPKVSVRRFLSWFGFYRRGFNKVWFIRQILKRLKVQTVPDFDAVHIDDSIKFSLDLEPSQKSTQVVTEVPSEPVPDPVTYVGGAVADPTYRIGKLPSANLLPPENILVSVTPNATLQEAVTLMLSNDFFQLPVMTSDRDLKGVISWVSIGSRLALGCKGSEVRHFMEAPQAVGSDTYLFSAVGIIVQHGYVLVRGGDQTYTGIVTATDLGLQFKQLGEPFLLLGEIENHIRRLIETAKFTKSEIQKFRDPADIDHSVETVADLTFGDYVRILQTPDNWARLGLAIDRSIFTKDLDRVREVRNDVMHFDPDGLDPTDVGFLQKFVRLLQMLKEVGVL